MNTKTWFELEQKVRAAGGDPPDLPIPNILMPAALEYYLTHISDDIPVKHKDTVSYLSFPEKDEEPSAPAFTRHGGPEWGFHYGVYIEAEDDGTYPHYYIILHGPFFGCVCYQDTYTTIHLAYYSFEDYLLDYLSGWKLSGSKVGSAKHENIYDYFINP